MKNGYVITFELPPVNNFKGRLNFYLFQEVTYCPQNLSLSDFV